MWIKLGLEEPQQIWKIHTGISINWFTILQIWSCDIKELLLKSILVHTQGAKQNFRVLAIGVCHKYKLNESIFFGGKLVHKHDSLLVLLDLKDNVLLPAFNYFQEADQHF